MTWKPSLVRGKTAPLPITLLRMPLRGCFKPKLPARPRGGGAQLQLWDTHSRSRVRPQEGETAIQLFSGFFTPLDSVLGISGGHTRRTDPQCQSLSQGKDIN